MFQSNGHTMFLSDDDVPSSKHPDFFNRLGLAKVFNCLAYEGVVMITEMLSRELHHPRRDEATLRTFIKEAQTIEAEELDREEVKEGGMKAWSPKMEVTAKIQRSAMRALAAILVLGEELHDDDEIARLDKITEEMIRMLVRRQGDSMAIFPYPPLIAFTAHCAGVIHGLSRNEIMKLWKEFKFPMHFCMKYMVPWSHSGSNYPGRERARRAVAENAFR